VDDETPFFLYFVGDGDGSLAPQLCSMHIRCVCG
jgi:hypothetical protein